VAEEELFAFDIVDCILEEVGFVDANTTAAEREEARDDLVDNTSVSNQNNQLLQIDYYHDQPAVAYKVAGLYADLFLQKTMESSAEETTGAFEFIISQVETYRNKLEDSESRLESFRSQYPGISTSTEGNVNARIVELQRDLEQASILYAPAVRAF